MKSRPLHHLLVAVLELERSRRFYREVIELEEIDRPAFPYPGAWFEFGDGVQLHLVVRADATMRGGKPVDPFDVHFAMRVRSYRETLASLRTKGFHDDGPGDDIHRLFLRPVAAIGLPQIYLLDPDRNVIEFICETLD